MARLELKWREFNARHFDGTLAAIPIALSSRMRRRLNWSTTGRRRSRYAS
jgi:hypothetical protein